MVHKVTRERVALPDNPGQNWHLPFDHGGFGFLTSGEQATWASEVLQLRLVSMDGVGLVVLDNEAAVTLQEFLQEHRRKHLVVPFSGRSGLVVVIFMFAR